ncbi:uncharacterized protein PAC_02838 [Phialocephala subalpina]|uniref:Uncharacterized protein n=1 Tax=Phialocephala subalpina TaxID=576137 RepID=A0A1L7WJN4_9HELO|nr:uncharacterized protein PAC_02838 [Phialocephala subalpina]
MLEAGNHGLTRQWGSAPQYLVLDMKWRDFMGCCSPLQPPVGPMTANVRKRARDFSQPSNLLPPSRMDSSVGSSHQTRGPLGHLHPKICSATESFGISALPHESHHDERTAQRAALA